MRPKTRTVRAFVALAVLAVTIGVLPAVGGAADEKPTDTEIGVTANEIHIAQVADVDNQFAPGLFQLGVDGAKGAVKYINSKAGGGGIGGRKLVLDFIDSHVNPNDARNGFITACENDFAMVGERDVPDRQLRRRHQLQGQGGPGHRSARHPGDVDQLEGGVLAGDLRAVRQPPRLQHRRRGPADLHRPDRRLEVLREDVRAERSRVRSSSAPTPRRPRTPRRCSGLLAEKGGIKITDTIPIASKDPQSAYTPVIQQMKNDGDNYNLTGAPVDNVISMRQEAQLQGLTDPKFVWTCQVQCYDKKTVDAGDVDGEHAHRHELPAQPAGGDEGERHVEELREVRGRRQGQRLRGVGLGVDAAVRSRPPTRW